MGGHDGSDARGRCFPPWRLRQGSPSFLPKSRVKTQTFRFWRRRRRSSIVPFLKASLWDVGLRVCWAVSCCFLAMAGVRASASALFRHRFLGCTSPVTCVTPRWFSVDGGAVDLAVNLAWVIRRAWFLPFGDCVICFRLSSRVSDSVSRRCGALRARARGQVGPLRRQRRKVARIKSAILWETTARAPSCFSFTS